MLKKPLVSVIVPVYNTANYLRDCLESVLQQSYEPIEVIAIDDGSTDTSRGLLEKYAAEGEVMLLTQSNQGQGTARNKGIETAQGKYLLFLDSDDKIDTGMVEQLVRLLTDHDADLVRFNGVPFFDQIEDVGLEKNYDFSQVLEANKVYQPPEALKLNKKSFSASPCLYMVKAALLAEGEIRFPEGILHEDEYFTSLVFLHSKKMVYDPAFYYHRRYRQASTMTDKSEQQKQRSFDSYLVIYRLLENMYRSSHYNKEQKQFIKRQMLSVYQGLRKSDAADKIQKKEFVDIMRSVPLKEKLFLQLAQLKNNLLTK